jgi:non-ribosomal peptide synthetase component F
MPSVSLGSAVPISFTRGTSSRPSFSTITEAFYHHASSQPTAVAARDLSVEPPAEISYVELAQRSVRLARRLQNLGVVPGDRVPLVVKRGVGMLVGIVSILSCGAQYVPLDGSVVADETLQFVLKQTGGRTALALKSTAHRILDAGVNNVVVIDDMDEVEQDATSLEDFKPLSNPDDGCYEIYTSGIVWHISSRGAWLLTRYRHYRDTQRGRRHPPQHNKPRMPVTWKPGHLYWSMCRSSTECQL